MIFAYKLLVITIALAAMALVWKHWPRESAITPQLDAYYDYVIGKYGILQQIHFADCNFLHPV